MNALAQKTYDLLMTQPAWFNMASHETCILGAAYRVATGDIPVWRYEQYFASAEGASVLGLSETDARSLCCFWPEGQDTNAVLAAQRLKAACDPVVLPETEEVEELALV